MGIVRPACAGGGVHQPRPGASVDEGSDQGRERRPDEDVRRTIFPLLRAGGVEAAGLTSDWASREMGMKARCSHRTKMPVEQTTLVRGATSYGYCTCFRRLGLSPGCDSTLCSRPRWPRSL